MELCKIIVVDDEYLLRQGIIHILDWEKYGFTVVGEAANATQTLELIEKVHPHIVLCDIVMPNIDGIELSKIIKKRYPETEIVILSSYDNFDYVKTAFKYGVADYILKPTLTANQLLEILIPIQKKLGHVSTDVKKEDEAGKQLIKMLEDENLDEQLINNFFNQPEYTMICYQCCARGSIDTDLVNDKIQKTFRDYNIIYIGNSQGIYMSIINHRLEDRLDIDDKWKKLTNNLENIITAIFLMKIDSINSSVKLLSAYKEIKRLSQYHFYGYENRHISISLETYKQKDKLQFDTKEFMHIAAADTMGAIEYLESYLNRLTFQNGLMCNEIKAIVQNVVYNLFNSIIIGEDKYEEVNTKKILFFNDISNANTLQEVIDYVNKIKEYIQSLITIGVTSKMMQQILEYINLNYSEQINLQEIAKEFHISYSYLSAYFNTHYKESFNDYLNGIRIQKAKEFLVKPSVRISYVSEMVGYSSPNYFTKVFKRLTGYTPTTYRRMYMK